ncbi:MAG: DUF4864 domain-containing protein [Verrucomicrobiota bacterium]|nr:DUF4864 domain-containing protein [Verrucomicrobiota bacterium]
MTAPLKAALLLFFFSLCGAAFVLTHHLREHRPPPAPRELFSVVTEQLAAFRASDFRNAYRQASTGVQQKFTLPQFEAMVRQNYRSLASTQRVEFGTVKVQGGTALVQVFLFSPTGEFRSFVYSLIAEDGGWKIGGVEELDPREFHRQLAGMPV